MLRVAHPDQEVVCCFSNVPVYIVAAPERCGSVDERCDNRHGGENDVVYGHNIDRTDFHRYVGFIYMGSCVDWVRITAIVHQRAHNDKLAKMRLEEEITQGDIVL